MSTIFTSGIDIPLLENVINLNFPAKPKLFVHRVGRCARAGQTGNAYSLIASDEVPYLVELHDFLSKPIIFADNEKNEGKSCYFKHGEYYNFLSQYLFRV